MLGISAAYLERKLRAITGIAGGNPLPTIDTVMAGLIVLEVDRPEWHFPGGEQLYGGELTQPAVVGAFGWVGLANPVGSGILAIVEQVYNNSGGAGQVSIGSQNAMPGVAAGQRDDDYARDKRHRGLSACELQRGTNLVAQLTTVRHHVTSATTLPYTGVIVLPPGFFAVVEHTVANTQTQASFVWRERPVEGTVTIL